MNSTGILHVQRNFITGGLAEDLLKYVRQSNDRFEHAVLVHHLPGQELVASQSPYVHALRGIKVPIYFATIADTQAAGAHHIAQQALEPHTGRIDAVHSWMMDETALSKKLSDRLGAAFVPIFGTAHSTSIAPPHLLRAIGSSKTALQGSPDPYICVSQNIRDICIKDYGFPMETARRIDDGIDERRFLKSLYVRRDMRSELGIQQHATAIGMAARNDRYKDPKGFLLVAGQILRKDPNAHFILAGGGMEVSNLSMQQHILETEALLGIKFGDKLHLLGERRDMERVYNALDVYLHTAVSEPFGLAPIEAKACGVTVAVTSGGDQLPRTAAKTIAGGKGVVHEVRQSQKQLIIHQHTGVGALPTPETTAEYDLQWSQAFADKIGRRLHQIADPAIRHIIGFEERMHVLDKYTFSTTAEGYMGVVEEALNARRERARGQTRQ